MNPTVNDAVRVARQECVRFNLEMLTDHLENLRRYVEKRTVEGKPVVRDRRRRDALSWAIRVLSDPRGQDLGAEFHP